VNKEIKITNIVDVTVLVKPRAYGFIEMWNPTPKQLTNLVPWLEDNLTVAFIWVYGEPEDVYDYSDVPPGRYTTPFSLGKTKEEAYEFYTLHRKSLIGVFE